MPRISDIIADEKETSGRKPMKDMLNFTLCANAPGDLKIKVFLVNYFENLGAFKSYKILKEKLCVVRTAKIKA